MLAHCFGSLDAQRVRLIAERPGEFRELVAGHCEVDKRRGVKCRDEMSYLEDIGQNVDDSLKKQLLTN